MRGLGHLRAREAANPVQGVRGLSDLRAREASKSMQGVWGREHLRAREGAKPVQGVRGRGHLRAREASIRVQGVPRGSRRGGSHDLPPRAAQARDFGRVRGRGGPGGRGRVNSVDLSIPIECREDAPPLACEAAFGLRGARVGRRFFASPVLTPPPSPPSPAPPRTPPRPPRLRNSPPGTPSPPPRTPSRRRTRPGRRYRPPP